MIDDDEDVRETLRDILHQAQHLPDVCASGLEAMTQRSLEPYDVIIRLTLAARDAVRGPA